MNTSVMAVLAMWVGWGGMEEAARMPSNRTILAQTVAPALTPVVTTPSPARETSPTVAMVDLDDVAAKDKGDLTRPVPPAGTVPPVSEPVRGAVTPAAVPVQPPVKPVDLAPDSASIPVPARPEPATPKLAEPGTDTLRYKIRDESGRAVVARLHGRHGRECVLMMPDGQLGLPTMLVPTDEPFRPLTADELLPSLRNGPLGEFQVLRTGHYLIFYRSTEAFAEASGRLLEDLYAHLLEAFRKNQMPVHEAEFPLVAVIYRTEHDFRRSRQVDPEVQAYYEIFTNRIYFYESSEHDQLAPEVTALRKPQTVAHEGTHQILQNIGVHPRLSAWPIWLIEGLAEYCATPASGRKKSPAWDGLGMINGLHLATIRELDDPRANAIHGKNAQGKNLLRQANQPLVESLIRRPRLTPTEYALAWAMTHYLAFKRGDEFISYLKAMSQMSPLEPRTPEDHLATFKAAFGDDLAKVDKAIAAYLKKLARQKGYDPMPFYAVTFEQALPPNLLHRAAMVSQSPQMIQQWIQEITNPQGGQVTWQALPHGTRSSALAAVEAWTKGY